MPELLDPREMPAMSLRPSTWTAIAHRWFVEYNPLYLVSAALVLVGVVLVSEGLARRDGMLAELWLTAVTELYQVLLIAAAALLYRRGRRRPALMLALLEVVYLGDLTFQTGVAPYFGSVGWLVSAAWLSLSCFKIAALAWALRLRLSLAAVLLPGLGAAGLAILPHLLHAEILDQRSAARVIALWLFALVGAGLWWRPRVESREALDEWGQTVLRRALCSVWTLWPVLVVGHAVWWSVDGDLGSPEGLFWAALLLSIHGVRREGWAWVLVGLALALASTTWLSAAALMAAVVLALRSWRRRARSCDAEDGHPSVDHPYRSPGEPADPALLRRRLLLLVATPAAEARRYLVGGVFALYVSLWTMGWSGGVLPAHPLWLILGLTVCLLLLAWRGGRTLPALLEAGVLAHLLVQWGMIGAPRSLLQWGTMALSAGFALLVVGFCISWFARGGARGPQGS
jgi:hypothetical protein